MHARRSDVTEVESNNPGEYIMTSRTRAARRRPFCPQVDGLESRELLNGTPGRMAEITAASHHQMHGTPLVPQLSTAQMATLSTIPSNGDLNPYGISFVPAGFAKGGVLQPGDLLVSNFNSSS